jgi:hypothetical protein
MSRKMKVLVSVLVAVLLLTMGGATMVLAQDDEEIEPEEELIEDEEEQEIEVEEVVPELFVGDGALIARVAEILGTSEEELRDAFRQAREELIEERFEGALYSMLDKAVEEGLLSDNESQEIREWWEEKPEALTPGLLQSAFRAMHPRLKPLTGNRFPPSPELRQKALEKALEKGLISPEKVEAIKKWLESRPEVSNAQPSRARIFKAFRNQQQIIVPQGWHGQTPGEVEA